MIFSLMDVAKELNEQYQKALENKELELEGFEKGERSQIFLWIIKDLFKKYGEYFGYKNISDFKSSVVTIQKRLKKRVAVSSDSIKKITFPGIKKNHRIPKEGDGESFLDYQIKELGLNPDSY